MRKESDSCLTPRDLFNRLDATYNFTLDAAADCGSALLPRWCGSCGCAVQPDCLNHSVGVDGLAVDWGEEVVWCNPPYSDPLPWVVKASTARKAVLLLKSDTSTKAFRECWSNATEIYFLYPRLKFGGYGGDKTAPFGNMLAVFDSGNAESRPTIAAPLDWRTL
jgi:hypothetical protein